MSEPQEPRAFQPPRQPFDPGAATSPVRPGCGKPLAIGCGLAAVLVLAAALLFVIKAHDILRWTIEAMRPEVERRLPEDLTRAERQRLDLAFQRAADRAESGRLDPQALQRVQRQFIALAGEEELSREELDGFVEALEAFAAAGGPEAGEGGPRGAPEPEGGPATGSR